MLLRGIGTCRVSEEQGRRVTKWMHCPGGGSAPNRPGSPACFSEAGEPVRFAASIIAYGVKRKREMDSKLLDFHGGGIEAS